MLVFANENKYTDNQNSPINNIQAKMKKALNNFESKEPLLVFNWKDSESEAEGWTIINSLRGDVISMGHR